MTVNELLEKLHNMEKEGYGDYLVRVYADHGQSAMEAHMVELSYIEEDDYMVDILDDMDVDNFPDAIQVVLIS